MQATRAYDALYDSTYTVSGQQDHYREQSRAGGISLGRVPQYDNYFSALGHHPAQTFRYKAHDKLPSHVERGFHPHLSSAAELAAASIPAVVSGSQRYLYSRRPLLVPGLYHPDIYSLHMLSEPVNEPSADTTAAEEEEEEGASRTIGTQSDYRESEAQTTLWDVPYTVSDTPSVKQQYLSAMHHCQGPELLTLRDLKLGQGLPVGLAEVEEIEKRRVKRAFEAALPPLTDLQQLPRRQQFLEAWEAQEWADKEATMEAKQEAKLARLEASLQHREEQIENRHAERIEAFRAKRTQEVQQRLAYMHRQRVSTILHIEDAQRVAREPNKVRRPDIIDKYSEYSSGVYAPMQREGRFPDTRPVDQRIDTRPFQPNSYAELVELEASVPQHRLLAKVQAPGPTHKLNYLQHREEKVAADLSLIASLLASSRQNGTIGDMGASYNRQVSMKGTPKAADPKANMGITTKRGLASNRSRTATPTRAVAVVDPEQRKKDAAALVLQRLLRGRTAQTRMYEGLQSRLPLIRELQLQNSAPHGGVQLRPESRSHAEVAADKLVGSATSEILRLMAETDADKRAAMLNAIDMRRGSSAASQQAMTDGHMAQLAPRASSAAAQLGTFGSQTGRPESSDVFIGASHAAVKASEQETEPGYAAALQTNAADAGASGDDGEAIAVAADAAADAKPGPNQADDQDAYAGAEPAETFEDEKQADDVVHDVPGNAQLAGDHVDDPGHDTDDTATAAEESSSAAQDDISSGAAQSHPSQSRPTTADTAGNAPEQNEQVAAQQLPTEEVTAAQEDVSDQTDGIEAKEGDMAAQAQPGLFDTALEAADADNNVLADA